MNIKQEYIDKCEKYFLEPGYVYVNQRPTIIKTILGSCISICIYDKKKKFGGMNHYILAKRGQMDNRSTKFGEVAIIQLIKLFIKLGSNIRDLISHIAGGAFINNEKSSKTISTQNINIGIMLLNKYKIPMISNNTGGNFGRKLIFYTELNELIIKKIDKINQFKVH